MYTNDAQRRLCNNIVYNITVIPSEILYRTIIILLLSNINAFAIPSDPVSANDGDTIRTGVF